MNTSNHFDNHNTNDELNKQLEKLGNESLRQILQQWAARDSDGSVENTVMVFAGLVKKPELDVPQTFKEALKTIDALNTEDLFFVGRPDFTGWHKGRLYNLYDPMDLNSLLEGIIDSAYRTYLDGSIKLAGHLMDRWMEIRLTVYDPISFTRYIQYFPLTRVKGSPYLDTIRKGYIFGLFLLYLNRGMQEFRRRAEKYGLITPYCLPFLTVWSSRQTPLDSDPNWKAFCAAMIGKLWTAHSDDPGVSNALQKLLASGQDIPLPLLLQKIGFESLCRLGGGEERILSSLSLDDLVKTVEWFDHQEDSQSSDLLKTVIPYAWKKAVQKKKEETAFYLLNLNLERFHNFSSFIPWYLAYVKKPETWYWFAAGAARILQDQSRHRVYSKDEAAIRFFSGLLYKSPSSSSRLYMPKRSGEPYFLIIIILDLLYLEGAVQYEMNLLILLSQLLDMDLDVCRPFLTFSVSDSPSLLKELMTVFRGRNPLSSKEKKSMIKSCSKLFHHFLKDYKMSAWQPSFAAVSQTLDALCISYQTIHGSPCEEEGSLRAKLTVIEADFRGSEARRWLFEPE
ncbi:MAG: hypothetical protein HUJ54_03105 [Erysipelotrichaceae bacterium]|nr:hypothetical protein [Erysipelotrichaceae bacterium]